MITCARSFPCCASPKLRTSYREQTAGCHSLQDTLRNCLSSRSSSRSHLNVAMLDIPVDVHTASARLDCFLVCGARLVGFPATPAEGISATGVAVLLLDELLAGELATARPCGLLDLRIDCADNLGCLDGCLGCFETLALVHVWLGRFNGLRLADRPPEPVETLATRGKLLDAFSGALVVQLKQELAASNLVGQVLNVGHGDLLLTHNATLILADRSRLQVQCKHLLTLQSGSNGLIAPR